MAPVVPLDPTWIGPAAALAAATDPWATTALFAGMGSEAIITGTPLPLNRRPTTGIDAAISAALAGGSATVQDDVATASMACAS